MSTTRLGLYGGPRPPYGSFSPKTESVVPKSTDPITRLGLYGGPRQLYGDFAPKTEADAAVTSDIIGHGWGYRDDESQRTADRNRAIFEKARRAWDDDLDQIIRRAFETVMGPPIITEVQPVRAAARNKVVKLAFAEVKTEGLKYRIGEVRELIKLYEQTLYEEAIEAAELQMLNDDDEAILALLMSM